MGAYKQFLTSDVIVTPFEVNKGFSFTKTQFTDPDVQIDRFLGQNKNFETDKTTTGTTTTEYTALVYNSIKELYYSNFLTSEIGGSPYSSILIPGANTAGDVYLGPLSSQGRYYNYLQTTLTQSRFFPTGSNQEIAVISIPSRLYGDYIQPGSFVFQDNDNSITLTDDSNGNLISGSGVVGNIIYQHGLAIVTQAQLNGTDNRYLVDSTIVTCSFSSSYTIFETQYKATIRESEFNFSQNPTLISSSEGDVYSYVTSSYFQPYVTTIGLYDEAQNLLAVGKLAQPYPLSDTTDTTFYINLDR
jgi:hypothetical protein